MALQQQPHKETLARLSLDRLQAADSSFSQKSNLALSILFLRNLGRAPSVVNDNGVNCPQSTCGPTSEVPHPEITSHFLPLEQQYKLKDTELITTANLHTGEVEMGNGTKRPNSPKAKDSVFTTML